VWLLYKDIAPAMHVFQDCFKTLQLNRFVYLVIMVLPLLTLELLNVDFVHQVAIRMTLVVRFAFYVKLENIKT